MLVPPVRIVIRPDTHCERLASRPVCHADRYRGTGHRAQRPGHTSWGWQPAKAHAARKMLGFGFSERPARTCGKPRSGLMDLRSRLSPRRSHGKESTFKIFLGCSYELSEQTSISAVHGFEKVPLADDEMPLTSFQLEPGTHTFSSTTCARSFTGYSSTQMPEVLGH